MAFDLYYIFIFSYKLFPKFKLLEVINYSRDLLGTLPYEKDMTANIIEFQTAYIIQKKETDKKLFEWVIGCYTKAMQETPE